MCIRDRKLIDAGLVKSAADLYDLTVEQLLPLGKKVDTWANNLVRSIEASNCLLYTSRCV